MYESSSGGDNYSCTSIEERETVARRGYLEPDGDDGGSAVALA